MRDVIGARVSGEAEGDAAAATQQGVQDEGETYVGEILEIVGGAAQTVRIGRRNYLLAITPYRR